MKNTKIENLLAFIFLIIIGLSPLVSYAYGLRTTFGKVVLEGLPLGARYSMRRDAKFPLVIKNESDRKVKLQLEVLVPKENEVQKGYEPIPSADWIKLKKSKFKIKAQGQAETDVIISVPDDEIYAGRKFHVYICSQTIGESLGVGLRSKLLFSVKGNNPELE